MKHDMTTIPADTTPPEIPKEMTSETPTADANNPTEDIVCTPSIPLEMGRKLKEVEGKYTARELCDMFHLGRSALKQWTRKNNYKTKPYHYQTEDGIYCTPSINEETARELYKVEGMYSIQTLAEMFKIHPDTIGYWREKNGYKTIRTGHKPNVSPELKAQIDHDSETLTVVDFCKKYNLPYDDIFRRAKNSTYNTGKSKQALNANQTLHTPSITAELAQKLKEIEGLYTVRELCKMYNLRDVTLRYWMKKTGYKAKKFSMRTADGIVFTRTISEETARKLKEVEGKYSVSELCKMFHLSESHIIYWMGRNNYQTKKYRTVDAGDVTYTQAIGLDLSRELKEVEGFYTVKELCEKYDISLSSLRRWIKLNNYKTKGNRKPYTTSDGITCTQIIGEELARELKKVEGKYTINALCVKYKISREPLEYWIKLNNYHAKKRITTYTIENGIVCTECVTPEKAREMLAVQGQYTASELCVMFHISATGLARWIKLNGYHPHEKRTPAEKLSPEMIKKIRADSETLTISEIAEKYHLAYTNIYSITRKRKPKSGIIHTKTITEELAKELYKVEGMYTRKELCEKYNINYARLSYWINKSGYKAKPKPKAKEKEPKKSGQETRA
jgi:hypothetical protein